MVLRPSSSPILLLTLSAACAGGGPDRDPTDTDTPGPTGDPGADTGLVPDTAETADTADTDTDTPPAPTCTLGQGEDAWAPLADGDDLEVIQGPQGGWHVLASVRCEGIVAGHPSDPRDPDNPVITWQIEDGDGPFGGYEDLPRPMGSSDPPELVGEFIILWTPTYAENLYRDATLSFTLTDATGLVLTDARQVHLIPEAGWEAPDTASPDTGDDTAAATP